MSTESNQNQLEKRRCPACGAEVKASAKFCSKCGAPLDKENSEEMPVQPPKKAKQKWIWIAAVAVVVVIAAAVCIKVVSSHNSVGTAFSENGETTHSRVPIPADELFDCESGIWRQWESDISMEYDGDLAWYEGSTEIEYYPDEDIEVFQLNITEENKEDLCSETELEEYPIDLYEYFEVDLSGINYDGNHFSRKARIYRDRDSDGGAFYWQDTSEDFLYYFETDNFHFSKSETESTSLDFLDVFPNADTITWGDSAYNVWMEYDGDLTFHTENEMMYVPGDEIHISKRTDDINDSEPEEYYADLPGLQFERYEMDLNITYEDGSVCAYTFFLYCLDNGDNTVVYWYEPDSVEKYCFTVYYKTGADSPFSYPLPERKLYYMENDQMSGEDVAFLQAALSSLGDLVNETFYEGDITTVFDEETEQGVKRFQEYMNLEVDGIVGSKTLGAIEAMLSMDEQ